MDTTVTCESTIGTFYKPTSTVYHAYMQESSYCLAYLSLALTGTV